MKKLITIAALFGIVLTTAAQNYPDVTQKYRYLAYFNPAMAGMNNNLDINAGMNLQPSGLDNSLNTSFFSGYYSTGASHQSRNSIRGTQSVDDYYARRKTNSLKFGFGTAVFVEDIGGLKSTYNSNTFAVHVPIAEHTYLSLGVAAGFNFLSYDVDNFKPEQEDDPIIDAIRADAQNTSFHIDAGLAVLSDEFYFGIGLNNLTNSYMSGNEDLTEDILVTTFMGGYRFYHSNDIEVIGVGTVNLQNTSADTNTAWNFGVRGRYRQILMAGLNYTSSSAFIIQLGLQANDYLNLGYSFSYKSSSDVVVNSTHEIGVGIRLLNHNKYSPIW
ncbi:MAG: PorP/SprF family type IX secretion system membrane protein [Cyclobacteriaceae bacterium]